jgi:hypothetical protein
MGGYNFDDDEDDGIFADPEKLAAGDPAAASDIKQQFEVNAISLGRDQDGFAVVPDAEKSILEAPERVDVSNFICLGGPCRHYTENARLVPEGPAPGAEENIEVGRWCGRVRTWAEQLDLSEAKIYACTSFEPATTATDDAIKALGQNFRIIREINEQRRKEEAYIGICGSGPCREFVEMLVKPPTGTDRESRRWCVRLGGLGRLYDLSDRPVVACSGWTPVGSGPALASVALKNIERIAQCRSEMAGRFNKEEETDDAD